MKIQLAIHNFPNQQKVFDDPAPHKVVAKGRRWGLTKGAANNFIKKALGGQFEKGLWVDVVNGNIDRYIERYFVPHLLRLPANLWKWEKQKNIVYIKDSYIDFRSADRPETIEGFDYDLYFVNEAGIVLRDEYLWQNSIVPMLWNPKATGVVGGTPKGKGLFFQLFQRGMDPAQPSYKSFRFSSFDSPHVNRQKVMDEIKSLPEKVVKQEIYAEFLDDTGVVFSNIDSVAILEPQDPIPGHLYVMGCDLAKVQDFSVLTVYDRTNNHQVYQMRFNQLEWPFQKARIRELSLKYNRSLVIMDTTGIGEPIYDDMSRDGVAIQPYKFTNESKKNLIEKLSNWIELSNIKMLKLEETISEFSNFTYDISSNGTVRYEAPIGFHDDIVISHALAVWSLQNISDKEKSKNLSIIAKDVQEKIRANKDKPTDESGDEYEEFEYDTD